MKLTSNTLAQLFENSVQQYGDRNAVAFIDNKPLTYNELGVLKNRISIWLKKNGIAKDDKVAILGENSPNWVAVFWSIVTLGATSVPLLPDFATTEVDKILIHSDTKILFISKRILKRHAENLKFDGEIILIDDLKSLKKDHSILEEVDDAELKNHIGYDIAPDDIANIIYTSGTTGTPKGVMLSHGGLTYECEKVSLVQDVNTNDVFLSLLPLSHIYENALGLIYPMRQGASIFYMSKLPTPSILMDAMSNHITTEI